MIKKYNHYVKDISGIDVLDIYRLLMIYEVNDPCVGHAIKKLLVAGKRGSKSKKQDIREAIDSLERCLEIIKEDDFF